MKRKDVGWSLVRRPVGTTEWEKIEIFDTEEEAQQHILNADWQEIETSWGVPEYAAEVDGYEYEIYLYQGYEDDPEPGFV
jgi:hypothetical protein